MLLKNSVNSSSSSSSCANNSARQAWTYSSIPNSGGCSVYKCFVPNVTTTNMAQHIVRSPPFVHLEYLCQFWYRPSVISHMYSILCVYSSQTASKGVRVSVTPADKCRGGVWISKMLFLISRLAQTTKTHVGIKLISKSRVLAATPGCCKKTVTFRTPGNSEPLVDHSTWVAK